MDTVEAHSHGFLHWPFADPENAAAFTTTRVLEMGFPILLVSHDLEGDWQFLCGTTTDIDHCKLICLGCALKRDSSIAELADLPVGWMAERDDVNSPWDRYPRPGDDV